MKKEIFLRKFPQELEYEASKLYNTFEIAKKYEIISPSMVKLSYHRRIFL